MKVKFAITIIGLMLFALTGCPDSSNNSVNNRNTNLNNNAVNMNRNTANANTNPCDEKMTKEEYEKHKAECEKEKGTSTIGQGINDSWIWFKTKTALAAADDLRDSTINVDVVNDVVTLKGTVANAAQKTKAEKTAKEVEGVKSVKNELQIKPNDSMTNQMVNGNTKSNTKSNANMNKK